MTLCGESWVPWFVPTPGWSAQLCGQLVSSVLRTIIKQGNKPSRLNGRRDAGDKRHRGDRAAGPSLHLAGPRGAGGDQPTTARAVGQHLR